LQKLTLYSRPGCHLCEDMAFALTPIIRGRASLEIVDVEGSPDLEKGYGLRIPVLVGGGTELSAHPLDVAAVEAFLASAHG
jgi:hypothetical protein